jgi:hypothetical protein
MALMMMMVIAEKKQDPGRPDGIAESGRRTLIEAGPDLPHVYTHHTILCTYIIGHHQERQGRASS